MGKEAKIGLSIIGILVIIFAVVLGQRLLGSKDDIAKNGKKASPPKKELIKKSDGLKKSPFSLFDTKNKKGQAAAGSKAKGKLTPTLAANQAPHGTSGVSGKFSRDWSRNRNKPAVGNPLMPNPTGGTALEAHRERGHLGRSGSLTTGTSGLGTSRYDNKPHSAYGNSSVYSTDYGPTTGSQASTPAPDPAGPHSRSHYRQAPYGTSSAPYRTGTNRYASDRSSTDSRYATPGSYRSGQSSGQSSDQRTSYGYREASLSPRTGNARLDTSKSYPRYGDHSGSGSSSDYGKSSRHTSSGYGSAGYGAASSGSANYGGGAQSDGTYIVKPHQNFWAISKDVYGTGAYFRALAEANRGSIPDENSLRVGDRIKTPDLAELEQNYSDLCPAPERRDIMQKRAKLADSGPRYGGSERQYIVQSGDTLYDIARFELGDAARWTEIYERNRSVLQDSFDYLTPGLKLSMPDKDGTSSASKKSYQTPSKYGRTGEGYRTETPRTASRPGYGYGTSNAASQPSSNNGGSTYGGSGYSSPYSPTYSR